MTVHPLAAQAPGFDDPCEAAGIRLLAHRHRTGRPEGTADHLARFGPPPLPRPGEDADGCAALIAAVEDGVPSVVLADTIIGKGLSFIEDLPEFHGRGLTVDEYARAADELGIDPAALRVARDAREGACGVRPLSCAARWG